MEDQIIAGKLKDELLKYASKSGLCANSLERDITGSIQMATDDIRNSLIEELFDFVNKHEKLKVKRTPIPPNILPSNYTGELFDVTLACRGPDDKIYLNNDSIRQKITRGITFLKLISPGETIFDLVVYANKKFSGSIGDEDEYEPETADEWMKYFIEPPESAEKVIFTEKLNGEAAHISGRFIGDEFYFFTGSKNVHMMIKEEQNIELYNDQKFQIASKIAKTLWKTFSSMSADKKLLFKRVLHHLKFTIVCEFLQPTYQHIVDLSEFEDPSLNVLCITGNIGKDRIDSLTAISPENAIELCKLFNLSTTNYTVIEQKNVQIEIRKVRHTHDREGCVLYFISSDGRTIGLGKVKTIWYILLRALREKVAFNFTVKKFASMSPDQVVSATNKRFSEIQKWLVFDEDTLRKWKEDAKCFIFWTHHRLKEKKLTTQQLRPEFPVIWKEFLEQKEKTSPSIENI